MTDTAAQGTEMKRSLTLTGVTVNAMALIAPGAFLWTTFELQAAQVVKGKGTASDMWTGLLFALILALFTAYSYSELARIYPGAGAGSSYYFAEAALLDKDGSGHRRLARFAKLSVGWISHLYYWIYPGIMIAFVATLFGYIYSTVFHHSLTYVPLAIVAVVAAIIVGYVAFRGISGSTMAAIVLNVIQITMLVALSIYFIIYRLGHGSAAWDFVNAGKVFIPHNFLHVLFQSTIAILLLVGFESVTALGAEAKNPEKDIRRGVLISLIIQGGFCYLLQYFAANFAIGAQTISSTAADGTKLTGLGAASVDAAPIGTMLKTMGGSAGQSLSLIVAVVVMLALLGTTLACLNTGVRVTYAMARDKEMPSILGGLHGKFATPHYGIWILVGVSALFGIYGVQPTQVDNITQITLASNVGTFFVYGFTCIIAIVAFASRHDKSVFKHYVIPGLGALMNIAMLVAVIVLAVISGGATAKDAYKALAMDGVWVVIGIVWVIFNPAKKGHKLFEKDVAPRESVSV